MTMTSRNVYIDNTDIYALIIHTFIKHCLDHTYILSAACFGRCYIKQFHMFRSKNRAMRRKITKTQVTVGEMSWNIFKTCENWYINHTPDGLPLNRLNRFKPGLNKFMKFSNWLNSNSTMDSVQAFCWTRTWSQVQFGIWTKFEPN